MDGSTMFGYFSFFLCFKILTKSPKGAISFSIQSMQMRANIHPIFTDMADAVKTTYYYDYYTQQKNIRIYPHLAFQK